MDSSNFVDLLNNQEKKFIHQPFPYESFSHGGEIGSSQLPVFSTQCTETSSFCEDSPTQRKERKKWSPSDDLVLISAWLNTSKDLVVGNEQKAGAFWKRIAAYYAASPKVERGDQREAIQCKQRWQKMNDLVCKFCGSYAAATRHKTSGQSESDVVKLAYEIFFNDHKIKMNKSLFMHIVDRLSNEVEYFRQKKDALGRLSLSLLQKCTTAIRVLAYGSAADDVDEYLRLGTMKARLWNIDGMHWEWKNCPTTWKGQYSRGSGKPTIVFEAVASYDLWIWHAFFGPPVTLNDINVLDRSPVFDDIIKGQAPQVTFSVNGREYHLAYYLTGGIYPKWETFIQSIPIPQEDERDGYTHFDVSEFQQGEDTGTSHVDLTYSTDIPSNIANMMGVRTRTRDRQMHQQLKADLVEHIWRKFGLDGDNY
uniref:Myb-like domain-containing protein n=1 Tax=Brassica oleracea var. oleracea TaxID=109376 RepID=A0A0D3CC19_BRAOL